MCMSAQDVWEGGGKRYRMEKVVGNGAFGVVWRAREENSDVPVAIKKVVLDPRYQNRELEMLRQLRHDCVIRLFHHFEKAGRKEDVVHLHLVMEFLPETIRSIALQFHKNRTRFPIDYLRVYLYQALRALEYISSLRICHRDLKPDNLLIDPLRLRLKLIDFGCAKVLVKGQPNVSYICSRYYRAPELLLGATEYTCAVDMWSIGTILAELLLGHLPFQGQDSTQQHLIEIMKLLGTPSERELRAMHSSFSSSDLPLLKAYTCERIFPMGTSARAIDLVHRLLCYEPELRLTASQALKHPFVEGVQYMLERGLPSHSPEGYTSWQRQQQVLKEHYCSERLSAIQDALQAFESTLTTELLANPSLKLDFPSQLVQSLLVPMLSACDAAESVAMARHARQVRASARARGSNASAEPATGGGSNVTRRRKELRRASDSLAQRSTQVKGLHKQLSELMDELQTLKKSRAGVGVQTEVQPGEMQQVAFGRRGETPLSAPRPSMQSMRSNMSPVMSHPSLPGAEEADNL